MSESPNRLSREIQDRQERTTLLTSLKGFEKLSERQKKILLQSLYIQDRAERSQKDLYPKSNKIVEDWSCFQTIGELERGFPLDAHHIFDGEEILNGLKTIEFIPDGDHSVDQLGAEILKRGFPCVVVIATDWTTQGHAFPYHLLHTFLAFEDDKGEIVLYEKKAPGQSFTVTTLDTIKPRYLQAHWGFRPFKVLDDLKWEEENGWLR